MTHPLFTPEDVELVRGNAQNWKRSAEDARWDRDHMTPGDANQVVAAERYLTYSARMDQYNSLAVRLQLWIDQHKDECPSVA